MPPSTSESPDLLDRLIADWARERPDLDASAMAVVGRVIHLASRWRSRLDEALKPFGLHYTDLDVLATLRRSGAPYRMTPTELTRLVLLTSGAMTAALRRLEAKGLLSRAPDPDDGRVKAVLLTEAGKRLIDEAIAVRFADAEAVLDTLRRPERLELASLLRRLTRAEELRTV